VRKDDLQLATTKMAGIYAGVVARYVAVPNSTAQYARAEKTIKSTHAANGSDEIQKPRDRLSEFWPNWVTWVLFLCAIKKNIYFRGG
jgi:hypothetical protein